MKKGRVIIWFKKTVLWVLVFSLLFSTAAFAAWTSKEDKHISIISAKGLVRQAAELQTIAHVFKMCAGSIPGSNRSVRFTTYTRDSSDVYDTIYNRIIGDDYNVSAGAWLEKEIYGEVEDGKIECADESDGILRLFANKFNDGKISGVLCNRDNENLPGLIQAVKTRFRVTGLDFVASSWVVDERYNSACWQTSPYQYFVHGKTTKAPNRQEDPNRFMWYSYNKDTATNELSWSKSEHRMGIPREYSNGEEYIGLIYENWVENHIEENPYLRHWDEIDDFSGAQGYAQLLDDFHSYCAGEGQRVSSGTSGAVSFREVDDSGNGNIRVNRNYYQITGTGGEVESITGEPRTCGELATAVDDYFDAYSGELYSVFKYECGGKSESDVRRAWEFEYKQAMTILQMGSYTGAQSFTETFGGSEYTWQNYTEEEDGSIKLTEWSEEDKDKAREFLNEYNDLEPYDFVTPNLKEGLVEFGKHLNDDPWVCHVPDGYILAVNNPTPPAPTPGPTDQGEDTCETGGGAGSLGWIVCPVLTWMQRASNDMYDDFVKPALQTPPRLFEDGNGSLTGSSTFSAWSTFQQIANVVFIILLLVVIFSQLTGYGIDNYGIKKILPKLIVAAILVNLSYYICVIAVDISNIFGTGLQGMFNNLVPDGQVTLNLEGDNTNITTSATISAVAILGGVMAIAAVWANPAILLSLLVSALGLMISIFFVFILLSARQAAIVVLAVISPVALVCYVLPNTKKFFDRWLKIGWGLLMVYPICGLLMGGGNFVSKLLLQINGNGTNIFNALIALLAGIVPIFFIPTVLKKSLSGLGDIGAKISGMGRALSGGAQRGIRNSDNYKAAQMAGQNRATRVKAGINSKGRPNAIGAFKAKVAGSKFGKAVGYQRLQATRVSQANKIREADIQSGAELGDIGLKYDRGKGKMAETDEEYFTRKLEKARDAGNENDMFAIIEQMRRSNMKDTDKAELTRKVLGGSNKIGKMEDGERRNFLEQFSKRYGGDFLKKDYEQADWAMKGGIVAGGGAAALGAAGAWAVNNIDIDDMKDGDVAAISSKNLEALINAGKISQAQAQRVWASNSNMDDTNRLMLGSYGQGNAFISKASAQEALKQVAAAKNGGTIDSSKMSGLTVDQVKAFTRRAAEGVVVEDVAIRNSTDGSDRQTHDLYVRENTGAVVNPAPIQPQPQPQPQHQPKPQPVQPPNPMQPRPRDIPGTPGSNHPVPPAP